MFCDKSWAGEDLEGEALTSGGGEYDQTSPMVFDEFAHD